MKDLEYLERLLKDLNSKLSEQRKLMPEEDVLVNTIYANSREVLLSQVLEYKETNPGLSSYLESLTKKILDTVSLSSKSYKTEKINGKIEILESLISQTEDSIILELKNADLNVEELKKRKEKDIRKIGERPKTIKEKKKNRELSWKYFKQQTWEDL